MAWGSVGSGGMDTSDTSIQGQRFDTSGATTTTLTTTTTTTVLAVHYDHEPPAAHDDHAAVHDRALHDRRRSPRSRLRGQDRAGRHPQEARPGDELDRAGRQQQAEEGDAPPQAGEARPQARREGSAEGGEGEETEAHEGLRRRDPAGHRHSQEWTPGVRTRRPEAIRLRLLSSENTHALAQCPSTGDPDEQVFEHFIG